MLTPDRPYTFDRVVRLILTIAVIVGVFYVLNLLSTALLPFAVAWLIAYLLNPIVLLCQRHVCRGNRLLGIVITLTLLFTTLTLMGALLLPSIINEFKQTTSIVQDISKSANLAPIVEQAWYKSLLGKINIDEIGQILNSDEWTKLLENLITHTWTILSGSVTQIINVIGWFIVLLYIIFILLDYDKIAAGFQRLIPIQIRDISMTILGDVELGMNRYFRGQALIALIVGVLFSIGFAIVGLPLAIPMGIFIGILNLVPYLQIIGFIPVTLLCLLDAHTGGGSFWMIFGAVMVVFVVVQSFQDLFLVPKIMGKVTGFSPAVILLSLSVWGTLLGVLGMIIALPMTTILVSYYQKYLLHNNENREVEG